MTEKERDTSPPQSLMGETNASRLRRETRLQRWLPKTALLGEDLSVKNKKKILSLFQAPGFRRGVNLKSKIQNPKSKIQN